MNEGNTWVSKVCFNRELESSLIDAIYGYMRLIGLRRILAIPSPNGTDIFGRQFATKADTMNAIKDVIGLRVQSLAKKGRKDFDENKQVGLNDELHCVLAIAHALRSGKECAIVTADLDLVEIFYKATYLMDTHYRAWLAAKMIANGQYGEPVREWLGASGGLFEGPLILYRRHSNDLREVLPPNYTLIPVHLLYVAPNSEITRITFRFEQEMLGMLLTKGATCGRCTDLFGESNLHVDLGPLKVELKQLYLGIGHDRGSVVQTADHDSITNTKLSFLDQLHSVHCFERSGI